MATKALHPDEVRRRGYEALVRELGPDGFIQFIQQTPPGKGDYTAERRAWLDSHPQSIDEVLEQIRRMREEKQD